MATKRFKKMVSRMKKEARNPEGFNILQSNAKKMSTKMTWPEKEFKKLLKELKVTFEIQKVVGNKIFDFYIPHLNLLVEIDGDYYHGNPEKFDVEDLNKMQAKNIRNDKFKDGLALGLGYSIERVWENDLKVNYKIVKSRFKKLLKS
jgi:very-short-patch-repair endonuclease